MFDLLDPANSNILTIVIVLIVAALATIFVKRVQPIIIASPTMQAIGNELQEFDAVVSDTVMRLAFSGEDLSHFEQEAEESGRDIRLVAAIYLIDQWTSARGYDIDEERIISAVEARLAEGKHDGIIPRAETPAAVVEDDDDDYVAQGDAFAPVERANPADFEPAVAEEDTQQGVYVVRTLEPMLSVTLADRQLPGEDLNVHTGTNEYGDVEFTSEEVADVNERTSDWPTAGSYEEGAVRDDFYDNDPRQTDTSSIERTLTAPGDSEDR